MWELMAEKLVAATQTARAGALYIGFAVYLICDHLGVGWWERTAIPVFFAGGCYILATGRKNRD